MAVANAIKYLTDDQRLSLYALYKQATIGPCNSQQPSLFDIISAAKWNAWNALGNLDKHQAKSEYVSLTKRILAASTISYNHGSNKHSSEFSNTMLGHVSTPIVDTNNELWSIRKDVFQFASDGDVEKVLYALQNGCDINAKDDEGRTMLHWAVDRSQDTIAQLLLKNNANVDAQDSDGMTALHYAISCGHETLVNLLLKHNASAYIKDNDGENAFDIASEYPNIVSLLRPTITDIASLKTTPKSIYSA